MKLRRWPAHQIVWRWHFYAGLFCIPFILLLSVTGGIYLFKPQVEAALDTPYEHLAITGLAALPHQQVQAALKAVPGAVLHAYELPVSPQSAVRVLVKQGAVISRVYLHPQSLRILHIAREDTKFMRVMHELHGNLLLGARGSYLVELAASWAIVMVITGLYLWWPKAGQGLAGVVYPRLQKSSRVFWRDLHAVTGFWISLFTLFLLISGLPWTKSWGGMLKEIRQVQMMSATAIVKATPQDWTIGGVAASEHAAHEGHGMTPAHVQADDGLLDKLVANVAPLKLAPPVLIAPPSEKTANWTARSDAQNRPLRVNINFDENGNIASRKNFADRPWLDRVIGLGVTIHEGQLFGWLNLVLGILTAVGLILLSVSGIVLWWKRLTNTSLLSTLGAPPVSRKPAPFAWAMIVVVIALGMLLPFFGLSLLLLLVMERYLMPYFPVLACYLGLRSTAS